MDDIFEVSQDMRQYCQEVSGKVLVYEMREALIRLQQKLQPLRLEFPIYKAPYTPNGFPIKSYAPLPKITKYPLGDLVYFVLDPVMDFIKIGYSGNLNRRFRELQLDWTEDLIFLGAIRGYRKSDERELHKVFGSFKCKMTTHREWFFAEKPLYFFINHFCEIKPDSN